MENVKTKSPSKSRVGIVDAIKKRAMSSGAYSPLKAGNLDHANMRRWAPQQMSAQRALKLSSPLALNRVLDMVRNNGWASSAVQKFVDNLIGSGWKLQAQVSAEDLGITKEQANDLNKQIERRWKRVEQDDGLWFDAERVKSPAEILGLFARHFVMNGEMLGLMHWREGSPTTKTCVEVVDPKRLSNPDGKQNSENLQDGVVLDQHHAAVGYHIREGLPSDNKGGSKSYNWKYFDRETDWGRPIVIHAFIQQEAGMSRGWSRLLAALQPAKQGEDYFDIEQQAAMLNAVMALYVTSPFDTEALLEAMEDNSDGLTGLFKDYRDAQSAVGHGNPFEQHGVKIHALNPAESIVPVKPEHPNVAFEPFMNFALRHIASCVGLTFEQITGDYSKVNYSSMRAALIEIWRGIAALRSSMHRLLVARIYRAWLEEEVEDGHIVAPDGCIRFDADPVAWCSSNWIGPARGFVDPQKEAAGSGGRMLNGTHSLTREAADQGSDIEELADDYAREVSIFKERGLEHPINRLSGSAGSHHQISDLVARIEALEDEKEQSNAA